MVKNELLKAFLVLLIVIIAGVGVCVGAAESTNTPKLVKDVYPGLASGALASARLVTLPSGVILHSGGAKLTQKDLDAEIAKAPESLRSELKGNLFFVLENKATRQLVVTQARDWAKRSSRKAGEPEPELLRAYFESLTDKLSITEDETRAFFQQNKDMMGDATYDQVKDQLKEYVMNQKRQEVVDAHIKSIGTRTPIEIDKAWAAKQYASAMNNPVDKGRRSRKPSLVDFGADGCRPCDMMTPILESVKKEYAGKLTVIFVHVRKEQILAARYGVQSIPVQVFFDKNGNEVFRHVGFFSKDQITAKLAQMGVK
jgi:thiol-disulfide isomerase/thioredoxin